jgi:DNA invertase Pin-like site-specific DNA recombinase
MQKALAYIRFSSDEQKDGTSIERQTRNTDRYAERLGLRIEKVILDEGKSAYKGEHLSNGNLGKFLAEADKGGYRGYRFLVEEQDRLSRQGILATLTVFKRILDAGMEIHVTEKDLVVRCYEDLDNLAIAIPTVVNGSTANEYTKKLSERVLTARASEREKARETGLAVTAKVPSWLRAEIGKKPVLIPDRAATVRRIFELAGLGLGAKRIVRTLEKEGRKPFSTGKYGQAWTPEFVGKTLGNRAVLGEFQPHKLVNGKRVPVGEPIPDYYPAVGVTATEFEAARRSVDSKNRNKGRAGGNRGGGRQSANSLFSRLVFDFDNRVPMVYHPGKTGEPYLVSKWQSGKKGHWLPYRRFEKALLRFLEGLDWQAIAGEGEPEEVKTAQAELDAVLADLDRCSGKIARWQGYIDEGSDSRSLFETLDAEKLRLGDLSSRQEKLAAGLAEARAKAAALHSPEELLEIIRSGSNPELRLRLKAEIKERVERIHVVFERDEEDNPKYAWDYYIYIRFINGARRAIGMKGEDTVFAKMEGGFLKLLRELEEEGRQ